MSNAFGIASILEYFWWKKNVNDFFTVAARPSSGMTITLVYFRVSNLDPRAFALTKRIAASGNEIVVLPTNKTKIQRGIQKTLTGYGIWLLTGKRDSPNFGHSCGIGKEDDIRDYSNDRSWECGTLVKKERKWGTLVKKESGMRDSCE